MATRTQTAPTAADTTALAASAASSSAATARLAAGLLAHTHTPYTFSFTPFLQSTYHHSLSADRPLCKAYSAGHCPLGPRCPDRHVSASGGGRDGGGGGGGGYNSLVCKHWLRGLCKKGEACEFLHEYNLRKMPECNFFLRNGFCSNGDECLYLHLDPRSKLPPCPDYDDRGFCALGPHCPKKHVRRTLCPSYLAGFCPNGRGCRDGAHPHWNPVAVVAPAVAAAEAEAAAHPETAAAHTAEAEADAEYTPMGDDPVGPADDDHYGDNDDRRDRWQNHRGGAGGSFQDKFGGGRWRGRGGSSSTGGSTRGFRGRGY